MNKVMCLQIGVIIAAFSCGSLSAGVDELFAQIEPPAPQNGLVFEIAQPKNTYFFFEPVTIFARFRNVTDKPMALVLQKNDLSGVNLKLSWGFVSSDGQSGRVSLSGILQSAFLIPTRGAIYFALPDKISPIGKIKTSIDYAHSQTYEQPALAGAQVWQGQITSNELEIAVQNKDILTPEERELVETKIHRHIRLFSSDDWWTRHQAEEHLVIMAKYSVPILVETLRHENSQVRLHAVDTLARIADRTIVEKWGVARDVSFLDALISMYDREPDPRMKEKVVRALLSFKDVDPRMHARVVDTLRKAITHTEPTLRTTAAIVLLGVSKEDAFPEVTDKIKDATYFGQTGQAEVIKALREETGQDFGTSSAQWN